MMKMDCLSTKTEWRDIPGYEGIYQASTTGFIRTVDGKITVQRDGTVLRWKSRILKGRGDCYKTGSRVNLWKDGNHQDFLVARLVALTFLGTPPDGYTVNHIDGNRLNNNVINLEWLSNGDNIRHGFKTGLYANLQNPVLLKNADSSHSFPSKAEASRFLGRKNGYVSNCLKLGRPARAVNGILYEIVECAGDCP